LTRLWLTFSAQFRTTAYVQFSEGGEPWNPILTVTVIKVCVSFPLWESEDWGRPDLQSWQIIIKIINSAFISASASPPPGVAIPHEEVGMAKISIPVNIRR
ncbi:hypothetical protein L195_g057720, partial [Trifolium pratense]